MPRGALKPLPVSGVGFMRKLFVLAFAGVCVCCQGCGLGLQATRVLTYRTTEVLEDHKERKRNREWAEETWNRIRPIVGDLACSQDYGDGFKDGFAEYLFQGGNCYAPSLPPLRYRKIKYQTPAGYRAIEMWYAGYQHGAAVADQHGFRRLVTGPPPPSGVPIFSEPVEPPVPPLPSLPPPVGPAAMDEPPLPSLPPPVQPPVAPVSRDEPPLPSLPQPQEQPPPRMRPPAPGPQPTNIPVWSVEQAWQIPTPPASQATQVYHTLTRWLPWPQ